MNRSLLFFATLSLLGLAACDRTPAVVTVPATPAPAEVVAVPVPVPGPPGAPGAPGPQGDPGKPGSGTTIVVTPAASAPGN